MPSGSEITTAVQAAIIAYRLTGISWGEISNHCQISRDEAIQVFQQATEQVNHIREAPQPDIFNLLNKIEPMERLELANQILKQPLVKEPESSEVSRVTSCKFCKRSNHTDPPGWAPGIYDIDFSASELLRSVLKGCPFCILLSRILSWSDTQRENKKVKSISIDYGLAEQMALSLNYGNSSKSFCLYSFAEEIPCLPQNTIAGNRAYRHRRKHPMSVECLQLAKQWIGDCIRDHTLCNAVKSHLPHLRMLSINGNWSNRQIRLVEHPPELPRYVALSHCWGRQEFLKTTVKNFKNMKIDVPWDELPQTFKDAVNISLALGFRYLWIDSLCIIQGSKEDWVVQSASMSDVYHNATLVLAASSSERAADGFLGTRLFSHGTGDILVDTTFEMVDGENTSTLYLSPVNYHYLKGGGFHEPLIDRGWTFQERLLARRFLSFNQAEMHWECDTTWHCECGVSEYWDTNIHMHNIHALLDTEDKQSIYDSWYKYILNTYSTRELTKTLDIFPAVSALARVFQSKLGDDYIAGLWKNDIANGLLWISLRPPVTESVFRAPSWSWASLGRGVDYMFGPLFYCEAKIIDAICTLSTSDPFGGVESGQITLSGLLTTAWVQLPASGLASQPFVIISVARGDSFIDKASSFYPDGQLAESDAITSIERGCSLETCLMRVPDTYGTGGESLNETNTHRIRIWCFYLGFEPKELAEDDRYNVREAKGDKDTTCDMQHDEILLTKIEPRDHYALVLSRYGDRPDTFVRIGLMTMPDTQNHNLQFHLGLPYNEIFQDAVETTITIM